MTNVYLLPGLDGTGSSLGAFVRASPAWANPIVVAYDPELPPDYAAYAADARSRIDGSAPHLILGESFSGPVATFIAGANTRALRGVVLAASFLSCPSGFLKMPMPAALLRKRAVVRTFLANARDCPDVVDEAVAALRSVPVRTLAARLAMVRRVDVRNEMAVTRLDVPYLQATHDRLVRPRAAEECSAANPNVRVRRIEGPHLLLQCRAHAAWEAIGALYRTC